MGNVCGRVSGRLYCQPSRVYGKSTCHSRPSMRILICRLNLNQASSTISVKITREEYIEFSGIGGKSLDQNSLILEEPVMGG